MDKETRQCQNCKQEFIIEPDDFAFYENMKVPAPTFCPDCRMQRRMTWRNERFLYKRECGLCKKSIVSIYKPQSLYTVYCHKCFRSDEWDALSHGRDYDFSKPFFNQFNELQKDVPRLYAMVTDSNVNSEYINGATWNKNCYLIFASDRNEDSYYSHSIFYCKNVFDCLGTRYSEYSIGAIDCEKVNNCFYSQDCLDSYNLYFCKNCANCHDCIGCANLRNQSFCIFNEQYSKDDYLKKMGGMRLNSIVGLNEAKNKAQNFYLKYPVKYYHGKNNLKSTGDYIVHAKNCSSVFDGQDLEDCKYLYIVNKVKDSYDGYAIVENVERNLEIISHDSSFSKFCLSYWAGSYGTYADTCENCTNVFGCIGLRNKQYCILNKQYTKEEYQDLVSKIIDHMNSMPYADKSGKKYGYGEFFPSEISPFAYNETVAQEFFPLTREEVLDKKYNWTEQEAKNYKITKQASELPDNIDDVDDKICEEVIGCEHGGLCSDQCATAFKITSQELQFYKKMDLPLPRLCSNCRHYERMRQRNPLKLWHRKCMCDKKNHAHGEEKCSNEFETSYSPDSKEIVYCEECYQQEVI